MRRHRALISLSRDHHEVLQLAEGLKKDGPRSLRDVLPPGPAERARHVQGFAARRLEPHFALEEQILFPAARGRDAALDLVVATLHQEHARIVSLVTDLDCGHDVETTLDRLGRALIDHVRAEERGLFEAIERHLSKEEMEALADRIESAAARATIAAPDTPTTEAPVNEKLTLYIGEKNMSSWSMRPYVALVEKEIPFEEKTILIKEDKDRSRRRALSPTGKVPVLQHGSLVIPDSLAIMEYLEETFPPPKHKALWPADAAKRAHARWLAAAMHSGFAKLRESMSFNLCFLKTVPAATPEALAEAKEVLSYWESALDAKTDQGPFLFGPFGAVDAMYAPVVVRLTAFKVDTAPTPKAAAYMKSVLAHPPVKRWMDAARALPPVETY